MAANPGGDTDQDDDDLLLDEIKAKLKDPYLIASKAQKM